MFSAIALPLLSLLLLAPEALSKPLSLRRQEALNRRHIAARSNDSTSFNNWEGIQSLNGFDSFNGQNNFDGSRNSQTVIVQEQETVCETVQVTIIQQQLVVLQEMIKRIITQQICEVETQTIVFQQFSNSMGNFQNDISRKSSRQVGYDSNIAKKVSQLVNPDGSLNSTDMGFLGKDVGNNTVVPGGNNWNDNSSPNSVQDALNSIEVAVQESRTVTKTETVVAVSG